MDKSESEILEEWDLVSSVYDTEQGNGVNDKKSSSSANSDTNGNTETSTNNNIEISTDINTETSTDASIRTDATIDCFSTDNEGNIEVDISASSANVKTSGTDTGETVQVIVKDIVEANIEETVETSEEQDETSVVEKVESVEKTVETNVEETAATNVEETAATGVDKTIEVNIKETVEADIDETSEFDTKEISQINNEEIVEGDEEGAEADTEEISEPDTEEITVIETIMYDVKKISEIDSEKATAACTEKITYADIENEKTDIHDIEINDDSGIKESFDSDTDKNTAAAAEIDININHSSIDNFENFTINSSLDSSMEHIQIEHCEGSLAQDLPELIPNLNEQENAALESSSSDIDIIDENIEESITSSFLHPLSLSISSSVDTSSILTSSEDKDVKMEDVRQSKTCESSAEKSETVPKVSEVYAEKYESYPKQSESLPKRSDYEYQRHSDEKRSENIQHPEARRPHSQTRFEVIGMILQFLRNMNCLEWSLLGGVVVGLYLTIVFNQTNIFAVVQKEDVVLQMKKMIDELKYDNKLLKDQMLSEMKNDKMLSSFEHQIKELRRENSRLNHMLYDVAKVLEKQKDSHERYEKREAEYLAPFKKEINKLKEHINILKFDNEELQKQLVRMRYASYSQGGKDANDDKSEEQKEETKADTTSSTDEIPLDINSLKKWNELISLLSKELGMLSENDPLMEEKSHSETKKNISWYWKVFLKDFKGTFEEFKANITSRFSDYKKVQENAVSDIYKFVKNFFTVEEQNNQQFVPPEEKGSQWKNIGDFFGDLKDKWAKIKNRIDTSDFKNFFKDFKMPGNAEPSQDYPQKTKSSEYEYKERKPTDAHFESDKKHDKVQSDSEDSKWMFERAALRAELRDSEKDDDVNWYLKKNKHSSKDEKNKY